MKHRVWSLLVPVVMVAACGSGTDKGSDGAHGGASSADAGKAGTPGSAGANAGTNSIAGSAGAAGDRTLAAGSDTGGAAGTESSAAAGSGDDSMTPSCTIPKTVLGSCEQRDSAGKLQACSVYWGSAFTPAALMAGCETIVMGQNVCPSDGAVGACETPEGPTALANYYYEASAGTPANQAQCNMNTGHVWCAP